VWFDLAGNPFPDQVPTLTRIVPESRLLYGGDYCFTPEFAVIEQLTSIDDAPAPTTASSWRELTITNGLRWSRR
jgi:6-methylsalicylate decarboxylase